MYAASATFNLKNTRIRIPDENLSPVSRSNLPISIAACGYGSGSVSIGSTGASSCTVVGVVGGEGISTVNSVDSGLTLSSPGLVASGQVFISTTSNPDEFGSFHTTSLAFATWRVSIKSAASVVSRPRG